MYNFSWYNLYMEKLQCIFQIVSSYMYLVETWGPQKIVCDLIIQEHEFKLVTKVLLFVLQNYRIIFLVALGKIL